MSIKELSETRPRLTHLVCLLILVAFTVSAYLGVKSCGFITFDDPDYITQNPYVKQGLNAETVKWAFTKFHSSNWHPLTWMSHMADVEMFGLKPAGHHLHNVVLHALNVCLIFLLLNRLTASVGRSFLVAALFALHPLHVESVAWVSERKDMLSTFFGLLCLLAYGAYARRCSPSTINHQPSTFLASPRYWLALVFFALGLMSKPMLVTWPFVMLLLDIWPLNRFRTPSSIFHLPFAKKLVLEKIPFFILAAASSYVTMKAQSLGRSVASIDWLPMDVRIGNSLAAVFDYLARTVYPVKLAVFYPFPAEIPHGKSIAASVLILLMFYLAIRWFKTQSWIFVGFSWFLGTLVPVIGLVQVGMQGSADRYTYIPHIGLFIVIVWGFFLLVEKIPHGKKLASGVFLLALLPCWWLTTRQVGVWETDYKLFGHAKDVTARNYVAMTIYGRQLAEKGMNDEALELYKQVLQIQPRYAGGHYVIGDVYRTLGKTNEALESFNAALALDQFHVESLNSRGALLSHMNRPNEAKPDFIKAIELFPAYDIPHLNLGIVYQQQGQLPEAVAAFKSYLKLNPKSAKVWGMLGDSEFKMGKLDQAINSYQQSLAIDPSASSPRYGLACALASGGKFLEAEKNLTQIIAKDQKMPEAFFQMGVVSASLNKPQVALEHLQKAVSLRGTNALYRYHLGIVLSQLGRKLESIKAYEETIQLDDKFAEPLNNLAWMLAADSDPAIRNGTRAVELAERAVKLTDWKEAFLIGTLAAAYAEAGSFDDAVKTAQRAIEQAKVAKQSDIAARNAELLELYRMHKPYHEPVQASETK